jgi:hypothetical protein
MDSEDKIDEKTKTYIKSHHTLTLSKSEDYDLWVGKAFNRLH